MRNTTVDLNEAVSRTFNFKGGANIDEVQESLYPVVIVEPRMNRYAAAGQTATGTFTVFTTPTDKDFYLTDIEASFIKDVACDTATGGISVTCTIDGSTGRQLIVFSVLTLTVQNQTIARSFNRPIKIDRGTTISFSGTFGAGAMRRDCNLCGFTTETLRGV